MRRHAQLRGGRVEAVDLVAVVEQGGTAGDDEQWVQLRHERAQAGERIE
jgi:hypothetical protein